MNDLAHTADPTPAPQPAQTGHAAPDAPTLQVTLAGQVCTVRWLSETGAPPPKTVVLADDTISADRAYRLACEGTGLLWQGDFQNARQLLQALGRRMDKRQQRTTGPVGGHDSAVPDITQTFHLHRKAQAERARILSRVLIPLEADHGIPLRRAPDVRQACTEAYGPPTGPAVVPLRELQGVVGAHEWRKKGVPVAALGGAHIHPHHGVFSPVRGEYLDLVAQAPLPAALTQAGLQACAWDIGTGTGVLAAVLLRRGVPQVVATELAPRALACADDNLRRLGLRDRVRLTACDLFPPASEGASALIVCNPPWLPGKPSSAVEQAIYDPDHRMLRGFLNGVGVRLAPGGEAWLILSDLAEHLGLRPPGQLQQWIEQAGLQVLGRLDTRPRHGKAHDREDPLYVARSRELTSLWRLSAVARTA